MTKAIAEKIKILARIKISRYYSRYSRLLVGKYYTPIIGENSWILCGFSAHPSLLNSSVQHLFQNRAQPTHFFMIF